jgi:lipid A disaccharide synthetase
MTDISFADIAIVSCGTLSLELNHLSSRRVSGYGTFVFHDTGTSRRHP